MKTALPRSVASSPASRPSCAGVAFLPRVVLMDDDYQRAMLTAELTWLESVIAELRSGSLTWSYEEFADLLGHIQPSGEQDPNAVA